MWICNPHAQNSAKHLFECIFEPCWWTFPKIQLHIFRWVLCIQRFWNIRIDRSLLVRTVGAIDADSSFSLIKYPLDRINHNTIEENIQPAMIMKMITLPFFFRKFFLHRMNIVANCGVIIIPITQFRDMIWTSVICLNRSTKQSPGNVCAAPFHRFSIRTLYRVSLTAGHVVASHQC